MGAWFPISFSDILPEHSRIVVLQGLASASALSFSFTLQVLIANLKSLHLFFISKVHFSSLSFLKKRERFVSDGANLRGCGMRQWEHFYTALYNQPWRASVSSHQVQCNIPTFDAVLRKYTYLFLERCRKSNNVWLRALMHSDCLYSSLFFEHCNRILFCEWVIELCSVHLIDGVCLIDRAIELSAKCGRS